VKRAFRIAAAASVVALIVVGVLLLTLDNGNGGGDDEWFAKPVENYPYPVQMFEAEVGAEGRHFAAGEFQGYGTAPYGTDPPTSGRHIGELAQASVYETIVPNEVAVHNMEHGFVIVWYNCNAEPAISSEECATLRNNLSSVVQPAIGSGKFVVQTPDSTMDQRIALTAWQFMDVLDEFDAERIQTFIDTFVCHYDPEGSCR
jgi:hypothetical protein